MTEFDYPAGATPLDTDEASGLLLPHITTRGELDRWEQENILHALAWLERSREKYILNERFIRTLHKKMFGEVWKWAGKYRTTEKNIGVEPFRIPTEVKNLCDDAATWIEHETYESLEIGARFHHRLVSIHPFPNGNGRQARLMTDQILEKLLGARRFTWGSGNLTNPSDIRQRYISALQAADNHDLSPLMEFVVS